MKLSLKEIYDKKQILLIGGLGFVGKVLLVMLLEKLPNLERIFLIVREKKGYSALDRFEKCLKESPVFSSLSAQKLQILSPIEGDASFPDLGLEPSLAQQLKENVDLVINSAGLVDFNPDWRDAWAANFESVQNVGQFVKESKKGSLLHISTCYVSGNQSGIIPEELRGDISPNGTLLNPLKESEILKNRIQELSLLSLDSKGLKMALAKEGKKRAQELGWPNTYTYTKALGESWLQQQRGVIKFTVVRPSIVESALAFPFPGWIEGFNTVAPIALGWYPIVPARKKHPIDIIPVDILSIQILKIGAALLINQHKEVYQCASSERHLLDTDQIVSFSRKWFWKSARSFKDKLKALLIRVVPPDHFLSTLTLYRWGSSLPQTFVQRFRFLRKFIKELYFLSQIYEIYLPFNYYNSPIFSSKLIDELEAVEADFQLTIEQVNWADYWINIQMPGLTRWCFPALKTQND